MRRPFRRPGPIDKYEPPKVDSARARANAITFLTNARSIDGVTADQLARQYRLKPLTAAGLLEVERERRGRLL